MFKFFRFLPTLALVLTLTTPPALAQEYFEIENFHSNIQVQEDSSLVITEQIDVNFSEARHGIFRDIDTQGIEIEILGVSDENGNNRTYQVSDLEGYTEIKIGDANAYVTGDQSYEIRYKVYNAIRNYQNTGDSNQPDSYDELYWNVTGNNWPVSIHQASSTVQLPNSLFDGNETFSYKCFTGIYQSSSENCHYENQGASKIEFQADRTLFNYEGLTIVLGLPSGKIKTPTLVSVETVPEKASVRVGQQSCESNCELYLEEGGQMLNVEKWGYQRVEEKLEVQQGQSLSRQVELKPLFWLNIVQVLFFLLLIAIILNPIYAFLKKGRDPKGKGTIIPQYEAPDKMLPAEMGTLYDETVHLHDLTSTIIDLCVRGHMKIKVLPKAQGILFKKDDHELIQVNQKEGWDKNLSEFERVFMNSIFGGLESKKVSDMEEEFYVHLPKLKEMLYFNLVSKGYMPKKPDQVRSNYFVKAFLFLFLAFISGGALAAFQLPILLLIAPALGINGVLTLIFAFFMPQKTEKGRLAYEHILGFKMYLETAERDRLKFEEKENLFYKFLPYAMTLGVANKWSKAFEGLYKAPPEWYVGAGTGHFSPIDFTHHLNGIALQMSHSLSSRPSNSGSTSHSGGSGFSGGFSGGGFGGGGGGSW